jgi:hypothetical protein
VEEAKNVDPLVRNDNAVQTTLAWVGSCQVQGMDDVMEANMRVASVRSTLGIIITKRLEA